MSYVQGFLVPVPTARRDAYRDMAAGAAPYFLRHGGTQLVEAWGDDVPDGKRTDMRRAVQATADEAVVFSWIVYPDRATCDAAGQAMRDDPEMTPPADMPFDGKRLIYAGFETIHDSGAAGTPGYIDGFATPVPADGRAAYLAHVAATAPAVLGAGATRLVENWGVDLPDGKTTDFRRAVAAREDEIVVFSWIEWPDKAARDAGMTALVDDPAMRSMNLPFDGARMIYGGFVPILDTAEQE